MTRLFTLISILWYMQFAYSQAYPIVKHEKKETTTTTTIKSEEKTTKDNESSSKNLELEVLGVYDYGSSSSFLVRLIEKEKTSEFALDMIVGQCEATALARTTNEIEFSRPLTYDVFNSVFEKSSLELDHILLTKLEDGTYYAELIINDNGKELQLDSRPSDAINLALKANVPIYVTQTLWDTAKEPME